MSEKLEWNDGLYQPADVQKGYQPLKLDETGKQPTGGNLDPKNPPGSNHVDNPKNNKSGA
jgi:hypothetical protein